MIVQRAALLARTVEGFHQLSRCLGSRRGQAAPLSVLKNG